MTERSADFLPRTDRWDLAAGGTVYAPLHPQHLHVPGFWDEVQTGGARYSRLLCVSFALETTLGVAPARPSPAVTKESTVALKSETGEGQSPIKIGTSKEGRAGATPTARTLVELFPYLSYWYWYPDRIEARYYLVVREGLGYKQQAGVRVFLDETRRVRPDGSLHCELRFELLKQHPPRLQVVAWGTAAQLSAETGEPPTSRASAPRAEPVVPQLRHTPFFAMLATGGLIESAEDQGPALRALHWDLALDPEAPVSLQVSCAPDA